MPEEKVEFQHNVFISWSGNRSQHVAQALREWLPKVLQATKPFMSDSDIGKGSRGLVELARVLEATKVGIICLTPENLSAPWLLFEAGALSKTLDPATRVYTYLLAGQKPEAVSPPLGQFQATIADRVQTGRMLQDINRTLGSPVLELDLSAVFDAMWPKLETALSSMPEPETAAPPKRTVEDMFGEILNLVRNQNQSSAGAFTGEDFSAIIKARITKVLTASGVASSWSVGSYTDKILYRVTPRGGGSMFEVVIPTNTPLDAVEAAVKAQIPAPMPPPPPPPPK
jgi:hypothetical protein